MRESDDAPDGVEALEVMVEPLGTVRNGGWFQIGMRPLLNLVSAVLAVLLVVVGASVALSATRGQPSSNPEAAWTASSVDRLSPRRSAGAIPRGAGWTPAGPRWAQTFAFSASAPQLAYTCGTPAVTAPSRPPVLAIGISRDAGRTWKSSATPAVGLACDVTVDPTDARDVVLVANADPFTNAKPLALFRTLDGGRTWQSWPLPPRATGGRTDFFSYQWAWVNGASDGQPSTFYLSPYFPDGTIYVWLAASVLGGAFRWVLQHALFPGQPPDGGVAALLGASDTLYMVLRSRTNCPPSCTDVEATTDDGQTWRRLAPSYDGADVTLLASGTAHVLFGSVAANSTTSVAEYVYSADRGVTWNTIEDMPPYLTALNILRAPDGTLFALLDLTLDSDSNGTAQPGIYVLAPGAMRWRFVATFSGGALAEWDIIGPFAASSPPLALSWDASGHATALWGAANEQTGDGIRPGIEYHTV